jgi:putative protease
MPAGNLSKLKMALEYGADAVYVGAAGFSMRPDQASFTKADLSDAIDFAHQKNKKIYVGINTLMFQDDLVALRKWLIDTKDLDFDAVIVSDLGAMFLVAELRSDMAIHISTQMSTSNVLAAEYLKKLGAERVVLARECTLGDAKQIASQSAVEVEIFVHGAMCMAISGRCLLSAYLCGTSGSKGQCKHSCRWEWQLVEQKRPGTGFPVFETGKNTIFLGSKDLCLIEHIPLLVESGISSLKVEGRMKSENYVASVAAVYRAALDNYAEDPKGYQFDPAWLDELEAVSHRPYCTGFAFGYPKESPEEMQTHNHPVATCLAVAYIQDSRDGYHNLLVKNQFFAGEELEWIGPGFERGKVTIASIQDDEDNQLEKACCGTKVKVKTHDCSCRLPKFGILRRRIRPG